MDTPSSSSDEVITPSGVFDGLEFLFFVSRDSPATVTAAKRLATKVKRARVVDKLSSQLDDLSLLVKHRVVRTPMTIILANGEEKTRLFSIPSMRQLAWIFR